MKRLKRLLMVLLGIAAAGALTFIVPFQEEIPGPAQAVLEGAPEGMNLVVVVNWYDHELNAKKFTTQLDFDSDGKAALPAFVIPTSVGKAILARARDAFGPHGGCEHCDGPYVDCFLRRLGAYKHPDKMCSVQNKLEKDGIVSFRIDLIPNEAAYEPREFVPADVEALLAEARILAAKGDSAFVEPSSFGPNLQKIDPVRAQVYAGVLFLWMGGKSGYALLPDSQGCPAMNMVWVSGTEDPRICRVERMLANEPRHENDQ